MSFRSSTSSFRRSLALGALVFAAVWAVVEASPLPRTGFFGGRKLAEKFVRLAELERSGPVEVLVVGPSYVDQGFDAGRFGEVTGKRAFNMGVQGTDMYFQSILLREMLLRDRAPEAVLWSLRDEALTRSNINRQYLDSAAVKWVTGPGGHVAYSLAEHLPHYQRRKAMDWVRELSATARRLGWETARGELRAELRPWLEPLDAYGRTELSTLTRQERAPARDREDAHDDDEDDAGAGGTRFMGQDYSIDFPTAKAHVEETLRRMRERGIDVWFFFTPYFRSVVSRQTKHAEMVLTGENDAYYDWINDLSAEFDAPVVDLHACAEISDEPRYFFDSRHLNALGAAPLGALMGELWSGQRPLPDAWRGVPAPSQIEAFFGARPAAPAATLATGERVELATLDGEGAVRHDGALVDLYARVEVARAGVYRVVLAGGDASAALYARIGDGHYRRWNPPAQRGASAVVLEAELAPGEHSLELHSANARKPIGWRELVVEPAAP